MKSFHFYRQYYKGEYDKYSPFVACFIACLKQEQLQLNYLDDKSYVIYNHIGVKVGLLFFGKKKERSIPSSSISITSAEMLIEFGSKKINLDKETPQANIRKHINAFLKSSLRNDLADNYLHLAHLLKKDYNNYLNFFDDSLNKNRRLFILKDSVSFFENSFPTASLIASVKDFLFYHTVFQNCITANKTYQNLLKENEIYSMFSKIYQVIDYKILQKESTEIIQKLQAEIDEVEIFLYSLLEVLNEVCKRKSVKLEADNSEYLNKTKWLWIENTVKEIKSDCKENKTLLMNSTSEALQVFKLLHDEKEIKCSISTPTTFEYYLQKIFTHKFSSTKVYLFDTIQKHPKEENTQQKTIFSSKSKRNELPPTHFFDFVLVDYLNHPISSFTEFSIENNYSHRRISFRNKMLASNILLGSKYLKTNGIIEVLTNNHLLYNSNFKAVRLELAEEHNTIIKEIVHATYQEKVVFLTIKKDTTKKIRYQKIEDLTTTTSSNAIELEKKSNWFNTSYLKGLKLYKFQKAGKDSIFLQINKGAFSREKKVPKLVENQNGKTFPYITKPFGNKVFDEIDQQIKEEVTLSNSKNKYINLGTDNVGNKVFTMATASYAVFNFLPKLASLSLLKDTTKPEFNISDNAYLTLRKANNKAVEKRFSKNILLKDDEINTCLEQLYYLTKSLPVLKKFVVQLKEIAESNNGKRVSFVILIYADIIEKFNKKRNILSKNAQERKRLLSSISTQLKELKKLLYKYETLEINYQKEITSLTKENIFYYCLALLNSKTYQNAYTYYLLYDLPRIYYTHNFCQYVILGKELFDLFQGNITQKRLLKVIELEDDNHENKLLKIKLIKNLGSVLISDNLEISGISKKVWDYQINGKSPLEWRIEALKKKFKNVVLDRKLKEEIIEEITIYTSVSLEIQLVIDKINALSSDQN